MKYEVNVNGEKVAVTKDVYDEYRRNTPEARRERYINSISKQHEIPIVELCQLFNNTSTEDEYIKKSEIAELTAAVNKLASQEKRLIYDVYFKGISERDLAKKYGVTHNAIHERKQRILKKIKNILIFTCAK